MSEGSKEKRPQQLAKSRRDYLAQVRMLTVDERTQEAAKINKALGIKAPKGTAAAATLDPARAAYIRLLGSLGSNAEVKAEVTRFCQQLDQMQLRMLDPKPQASNNIFPVGLRPLGELAGKRVVPARSYWAISGSSCSGRGSWRATTRPPPSRKVINRSGSWAISAW
jgi:hypothetical protein